MANVEVMARVRSSRSNGRRARGSARPRGRASALKAKGGRPLSNARASTRARSARAHEVRRARSGLYAPGSTPARARPMSFNAFDARRRASRSDVTRHCEWNSCFAALSQNGNAALPPFRSFSIRVREPAWTVPRVRSQRIAKKKGIVFFFQPARARASAAAAAADETPTPRVVVNQKPPHHIVAHPPSPISARPRSPPAPSCPPACWT